MASKDHPMRAVLATELNARPYGAIAPPAQVSHLALACGENTQATEIAYPTKLCGHFQNAPPAQDATLFNADLGAFRLKWERHTEFSAYTFITEGNFEVPFKETAIATVPEEWLSAIPGDVIAALYIAAQTVPEMQTDAGKVRGFFDNNTLVGESLTDGQACW